MARLSSTQWLSRLRDKGWTRSQIQQATGASPSTQLRVSKGHASKYDDAIREIGSKYSRRKTVPPEYPHIPKPHISLDRLLAQLASVDLEPDEGELASLTDRFGASGMKAILKGQWDANRHYLKYGYRNRGDDRSWYRNIGPDMMRRFNQDGFFDPSQYAKQLWYVGIKP